MRIIIIIIIIIILKIRIKWSKAKKVAKRSIRENLLYLPIFDLVKKIENIDVIDSKIKNQNKKYNILNIKKKLKLKSKDVHKASRRLNRRKKKLIERETNRRERNIQMQSVKEFWSDYRNHSSNGKRKWKWKWRWKWKWKWK